MKKLFTNDKFFLAMVLCAVIGDTAYAVLSIFVCHDAGSSSVIGLLPLVCVLTLFISYKRHSKNVMKGMIGALLMAQLYSALLFCSYPHNTSASYICCIVFAVLAALLFVNHFIINSDRKASPNMITINQIISVLLVAVNIIWTIAFTVGTPDATHIITTIFDIVGFSCIIATVVCVESRLDAYRLDREAAGWTEEAGYPEGYVHEYEKKDTK